MYLKDQATSMVGMGLEQIVPWDKYYFKHQVPIRPTFLHYNRNYSRYRRNVKKKLYIIINCKIK